MREIKFRAWHKIEKYMTPSFRFGHEFYHNTDDGIHYDGDDVISFSLAEDYILMQYTGLKDKNGEEIYEGDILEPIKGLVDTNAVKRFVEKWSDYRGGWMIGIYNEMGYGTGSKGFKIIGNIYENPKLLKGISDEEKNKELE